MQFHAKIIQTPGPEYGREKRFWQGCPTIARTAGGRWFVGWYSGGEKEPDPRNYNLLVKSDDGGHSWSERPILVIDSCPELFLRALDIELWIAPNRALWCFYVQKIKRPDNAKETTETWAIICENPDAETLCWSEPRFISGGFLRCKPLVAANGQLYLGTYEHESENYLYSVSPDGGETFIRGIGPKKIPTFFDESMFFQHRNGDLILLARTACSGHLAQAVSHDGGLSWESATDAPFRDPGSRFFVTRLKSGRLLLINNDHPDKRRNLTAFLSEDDGVSWPYRVMLDSRDDVSYPDADEDENGNIIIVWDYQRNVAKCIQFACVTEKSIIRGISPEIQLLSQAPAWPEDAERAKKIRAAVREWEDGFNAKVRQSERERVS